MDWIEWKGGLMEFPKDVMEAARAAFSAVGGAVGGGQQLEVIARAILAERARCAKLCRDATNSTIGEAYAKVIEEG